MTDHIINEYEARCAAEDATNISDTCVIAGEIAQKHGYAATVDEQGDFTFKAHEAGASTKDRLARNFAALLRHELGDLKVREVALTNAEPGKQAFCHSGDLIDSNMTMHDAFLLTMGRASDSGSQEDAELWNGAWDEAKACTFWCDLAIEALEQQADERIHELARALMATRPDLTEMSLDEWLAEHFEKLTDAQRRAATAIIEMHQGG